APSRPPRAPRRRVRGEEARRGSPRLRRPRDRDASPPRPTRRGRAAPRGPADPAPPRRVPGREPGAGPDPRSPALPPLLARVAAGPRPLRGRRPEAVDLPVPSRRGRPDGGRVGARGRAGSHAPLRVVPQPPGARPVPQRGLRAPVRLERGGRGPRPDDAAG